MTALAFFVPGKPQTAGSKTAVPMGSRMGVIEAGTKESRARKKTWRGDLRDAAIRAMEDGPNPGMAPSADPLSVTFVIVRKRPSDHMRSGRFSGLVKDTHRSLLPVQRPDTVKIVRAAEDALTGVLWVDDSQIVVHRLWKAYGDQVGLSPLVEGLYVSAHPVTAYHGPYIVLSVADTRLEAAA